MLIRAHGVTSPPSLLPWRRADFNQRTSSASAAPATRVSDCAWLILVACVVLALSACAHVVDARANPSFTLGVWNILHDDRDVPFVAATLRASPPDVIGLSEVTPSAWVILDEALGGEYATRHFFDELAVFSRLPIEDIREIPVEYGRKAQLLFTVVVDGARVDVALLHLQVPHLDTPSPASVWRMLNDAEQIHADEVAFALRRLKRDLPVIVMGDFNSLPFDDTRQRMAKKGFRDTAGELQTFPASTWRGPLFGIEAPLRIDYMFISDGITPKALDVTETHASDHALLVGQFQVDRRVDLPR